MNPEDLAEEVRSLVIRHSKYREHCLNLLAAENIPSPCVREIVGSNLMGRDYPILGNQIDKRWGPGSGDGIAARYMIEIDKIVVDLAKKVFNAKFVEHRPLAGQMAIQTAITAFTDPGDSVFQMHEDDGGHSWPTRNPAKYKPDYYVFDRKEWNIDVEATAKKVRDVKPKLLVTGTSFYLFPHPVKELKEIADKVDAAVAADEAHVFGLIAGKQWPNALDEGADVLTGDTQKSFFGPVKGLALTNDEETATKVANAAAPGYVGNYHGHETAALAIALAESLKFGEAYAKQVIKNAKVLAETLHNEGFDVMGESKGFTESHQVLVDTSKYMAAIKAAEQLEYANILSNHWETKKLDFDGLRIGVAEATRMGLKEDEMKQIAKFISRVVKER